MYIKHSGVNNVGYAVVFGKYIQSNIKIKEARKWACRFGVTLRFAVSFSGNSALRVRADTAKGCWVTPTFSKTIFPKLNTS